MTPGCGLQASRELGKTSYSFLVLAPLGPHAEGTLTKRRNAEKNDRSSSMATQTPAPQQGGSQTPSQQQGQSGTPTPQQGSTPVFRDWASI
jgi:hypothetical protein